MARRQNARSKFRKLIVRDWRVRKTSEIWKHPLDARKSPADATCAWFNFYTKLTGSHKKQIKRLLERILKRFFLLSRANQVTQKMSLEKCKETKCWECSQMLNCKTFNVHTCHDVQKCSTRLHISHNVHTQQLSVQWNVYTITKSKKLLITSCWVDYVDKIQLILAWSW